MGVGGLSAAIHLDRLVGENTQITLFDARRQPGGRTRSFTDPKSGDTLDNGQHLLMGCYRDTLEYCQLLGTEKQIEWQDTMEIPFYLGEPKPRTLRMAKLPSPFHLLWGLLSTNLLSFSEKIATMRLGQGLKSKRNFGDLTCIDLLHHFAQPAGLIEKLWEPMILAVLNASPKQASASAFVEAFRLIYFGEQQDASLIFPTSGLSELLIDPAVKILESKGHTLRYGEVVEKITSDLTVSASSGLEQQFDAVILASTVGPSVELPVEIPAFEYSPILNAYFWVDREIIANRVAAFVGTNLQWAFPHKTNLGAQRLALTISAADDLIEQDNKELTDRLWKDLQSRAPEAREAVLLKSQIIKEKRATPLFTPEAHRRRPSTVTPVSGLFLAGDIVQNGLPATIEGAVRNGKAAASILVASTK